MFALVHHFADKSKFYIYSPLVFFLVRLVNHPGKTIAQKIAVVARFRAAGCTYGVPGSLKDQLRNRLLPTTVFAATLIKTRLQMQKEHSGAR